MPFGVDVGEVDCAALANGQAVYGYYQLSLYDVYHLLKEGLPC
jgi:hypothetical protein